MHHLKKLAALAVIACLAGAGSASATTLCTTSTTGPCPSANVLPSGTVLNLKLKTGTNAVATTSGGSLNPTYTCTTSTGALTTTSAGGGSGVNVTADLTSLTFSGCTSVNPSGCSTTWSVSGLPTAVSFAWTSGTSGTVTLAMPILQVTCSYFGFPITCSFGGNSITGTVVGGNPAELRFVNQTLVGAGGGSGFTCPTAMSWNATYVTTGTRTAVWVTSA